MSGGHFDYAQHKITDIVSKVEELIENNWREFTPATIASFRVGSFFLRVAAVYAQRIDWLVSGDDGEETFHQRLAKELERDKDVAIAHLIDAAPELYAVLEELEESSSYWSEYYVPLGIVERIQAALRKARGERMSAYPPVAEEPEDEPPTPTQHSVSTETLHHFRCGSCGLWWSIADDPTPKALRSCPHCGTKGRVEELA